jgi:hypothetical protein
MKNLFKALAEFQQEVPVIHKDTAGFGYTYTNLTNILTTINPLMKKHGLGFTQLLEGDGLKTIIFHSESGELLESTADIPSNVVLKGMNAFQVLGAANTYLRRYALSSALGLISDKDIDACGDQVKLQPSDKLKECKTLKELEIVYTSLTRTEQTAMTALKDELKQTLS